MGKFVVAICGNIGVGKSTLAKILSRKWNFSIVPEPQNKNPFLQKFYKEPKRWALHSQLFFLLSRLKILEHIEESSDSFIIDRTIYEDAEIFAKLVLTKNEYNLYREVYKRVIRDFPSPHLLIYLFAPVKVLKKRIETRGRAYEKDIKISYLKKLNKAYEEWIEGFRLCPVYRLNTEEFDLNNLFSDTSKVIEDIEKFFWEGRKNDKRRRTKKIK